MEGLKGIAQRVQVGRAATRDESREARRQFADEMRALAASYRHEMVDDVIRVYWNALKDIPVEIRTAGLTQCLKQIKFFPTVDEVLNACADVVDARRKVLAKQAESLKAECQYRQDGVCTGRWRDSHDASGTPCVIPCACHSEGVKLLASADKPIQRPALPPAMEAEG